MKYTFLIILYLTIFLSACEQDEYYAPKPRGYFRIALPKKNYTRIRPEHCPFNFELPVYGQYKSGVKDPCWPNIEFKKFNATLHLSYIPITSVTLKKLIDDAHIMVNHHQVKSTGIEDIQIIRDSARVFGTLFEIKGNSASALQFYVTDSTNHFIRGALYFNCRPNADSLKRSTDFLKQDVIRLLQTLQWFN